MLFQQPSPIQVGSGKMIGPHSVMGGLRLGARERVGEPESGLG